ncbi:hypothetical protein ACFVVM_32955 [Nocardia sp. NPDC058176]|uniref:hypothetical protein n=1 Tax=Nocardia sp. NPDC058176 TaxID=3346368 RepID=UPI0036DCEB3E
MSTVRSLDALRRALDTADVATVAASLVDGVHGADIDAEDPVVGDAVAEALVAWCVANNLPYLVRESGRPGGRHVITAITHHRVDPAQWRALCKKLSQRYRVVVDDRSDKALRLLTAPHRLGLPSPIISCTLTPGDVIDARNLFPGRETRVSERKATTKAGKSARRVPDGSRSEAEYRVALVLARRGYTAEEAWTELKVQLSDNAKVFEPGRGRDWWQRYVWLSAVTTVAAEQRLHPDQAWALIERDRMTECGRPWWDELWSIAVAEAATGRPRATTLVGELSPTALDAADPGEAEAMRRGLHEAVEVVLASVDPRRRQSVLILLCALVPALLVRGGSMSMRHIAERGQIRTSTVQSAVATAVEYGLLVISQRYGGGTAKTCQVYALGPAALSYIRKAQQSSPHTSCSTPAPTGSANQSALTELHAAERAAWTPRCDVLAALAPGERLATSQHPLAKNLRSTWAQRNWWRTRSPEEQAERLRLRRETLAGLHRSTRNAWFDWLVKREQIAAAAARISSGAGTDEDGALVTAAPIALHRGLKRPPWTADSVDDGQGVLIAA